MKSEKSWYAGSTPPAYFIRKNENESCNSLFLQKLQKKYRYLTSTIITLIALISIAQSLMTRPRWFYSIAIFICMVLFCADVLATERSGAATTAAIYTPNIHAKSMTIPEAAGASGNVVFIGGGGTYQSAYSNRPDGAIVFGYGLGNAQKLGVQLMLNSLNMDKWDQYSFSAHVFRELNDYRAIGMGVESIPLTSGGDAPVSYYAVYSAGVQNRHFINKNEFEDIKNISCNLNINDKTYDEFNSKDLFFNFDKIISDISKYMMIKTLLITIKEGFFHI